MNTDDRYQWLREQKFNQLILSHNEDASANYVSVKEWIEEFAPKQLEHCDPLDIQKMKDENSIWQLQIYPHTPVGFYVFYAASLDSVIDAAMTALAD